MPRQPKEESRPTLRMRALRLLARREFTRHELAQRLAPFAAEASELAQLLDEFARCGWLSEARAVEQIVHARRSRFGSRRIRHELEKRGVDSVRVAAAVEGLKAGEPDAVRAIWRRKFGRAPRTPAERARQIRFLQGRGFDLDLIVRVIESSGVDDEAG